MTETRFIVADSQRRQIMDLGDINDVLEMPPRYVMDHHTVVLQERENGQWTDVKVF